MQQTSWLVLGHDDDVTSFSGERDIMMMYNSGIENGGSGSPTSCCCDIFLLRYLADDCCNASSLACGANFRT